MTLTLRISTWHIQFSSPANWLSWNSRKGKIVLFCLFMTYFSTTLYWYRSWWFWKPLMSRVQPYVHLRNPSTVCPEMSKMVCGPTPWESDLVQGLWVSAQPCTPALSRTYLDTQGMDFWDEYMAVLGSLRAFRIIMTYISTKWSKNKSEIGKIVLSSLYCCSKRVNWLESWTVYVV